MSVADQVKEARQFAVEVVEQLRDAGFEALWAGGCVRDLLMGNDAADFDVATSATPQQVRQLFGFRRTLPVGISFGVVIVLGATKAAGQVEVATFRTDSSYSDGRRPDAVTFSTPEEDASRRDFTINGMFYDPLAEHIIDYVGGQEDLRRRVIRAIGDPHARLAEDKLRMLRAVRFAARFGFEIDEQTRAAIQSHAREVAVVSAERIADEVRKTLQTAISSWAIQTWHDTGLLQVIAPAIDRHWAQIRDRAIRIIDAIQVKDWLAKAAALHWLLHEEMAIPVDVTQLVGDWKQRLKLANEEATGLTFAIQSQEILARADELPWSQVQPWFTNSHIATGIAILAARCAIDKKLQTPVDWITSRLKLPADQLNPAPLLDGQDLQQTGLKPGPNFRTILQTARALQLDGQLHDRTSALDWLKALGDDRRASHFNDDDGEL